MWTARRSRARVVRPVRRRPAGSPAAIAVDVVVARKVVRSLSERYFNATATRSWRESCGMSATVLQSPVIR
jgi:hypothetical protein